MSERSLTLDEVCEKTSLAARWEARTEIRAKERKALEIARKMIEWGYPPETIITITELAPEKINALYEIVFGRKK